jgi:lysophospholipase L1-like esterase
MNLRSASLLLKLATLSAALTLVSPQPARAQDSHLTGTWVASPLEAHAQAIPQTGETIRNIVHTSLGSTQFAYITLSNEFGKEPLTLTSVTLAHVADHGASGNTDKPVSVTFGGRPGITIPPGQRVTSDQTLFAFAPQSDVAVSLFVPAQPITSVTQHSLAEQTNYIAPGDQTAATSLAGAKPLSSWRYVVELDTVTPQLRPSIICLGDSITDGYASTPNTNNRWPNLLAARILADKRLADRVGGVLDEGISGNRLLLEGFGPSAVDRVGRDVLSLNGPPNTHRKYLIILEGINDIGHGYADNADHFAAGRPSGETPPNAGDLIASFEYLIGRAHAHGMKVFGATLTPYLGAKYASPAGERVRQALNHWIRTTKDLDGVIDFDKTTRDPANPGMFLPAYDHGDHLHPSDAGYKAMADSIDLSLFTK